MPSALAPFWTNSASRMLKWTSNTIKLLRISLTRTLQAASRETSTYHLITTTKRQARGWTDSIREELALSLLLRVMPAEYQHQVHRPLKSTNHRSTHRSPLWATLRCKAYQIHLKVQWTITQTWATSWAWTPPTPSQDLNRSTLTIE